MLIVQYDPKWVNQFKKIKSAIDKALSELHFKIEHIGSTAVPNLGAKSIIDIDLIYFQKKDFSKIQKGLATLGYYHHGNQGIAGREVFKREKGSNHPILDAIVHHLYVCPYKSEELKRHILFRNYLIDNHEARIEYEDLKIQLAIESNQNKEKYAVLKQERAKAFVDKIIKKATK